MNRRRAIRFLEYLAVVSIILAMSGDGHVFLLAPPYAVSAYLALVERESKFSGRAAMAASYSFAVASSEAIHVLLGPSLASMAINVLAVSTFMAFTRHAHPPAIALTIFSYLKFSDALFVTSSLIALGVIVAATLIDDRLNGAEQTIPRGG